MSLAHYLGGSAIYARAYLAAHGNFLKATSFCCSYITIHMHGVFPESPFFHDNLILSAILPSIVSSNEALFNYLIHLLCVSQTLDNFALPSFGHPLKAKSNGSTYLPTD